MRIICETQICWVFVIFCPRLVAHMGGSQGVIAPPPIFCVEHNRGVTRRAASPLVEELQGGVSPFHGVQVNTQRIFFFPYIRWANLPMVLYMGFSHDFGHGFFPMVFCRFGQGNYCYLLIQG